VQWVLDYKIVSAVGLYTVAPPTYQAGAMGSRLQNHQRGRVVQQCTFLPTRLVQWDLDYKTFSIVGLYTVALPTYHAGAMGLRLQNRQCSRVVHCCTAYGAGWYNRS